MGRIILFMIVLAAGLVVGYLVFGRVAGQYVSISRLLQPAGNVVQDIAEQITGVKKARQSILVSAAVGAGVGLIVGVASRRRG
jgi:hypothetical protein